MEPGDVYKAGLWLLMLIFVMSGRYRINQKYINSGKWEYIHIYTFKK